MTMIRAIKIDHGPNPECSLLGIHVVVDIRYITNDSKSGCYKCVRCFNHIFYRFILVLVAVIWYFWQFCLFFLAYFLEFKTGFDQGL